MVTRRSLLALAAALAAGAPPVRANRPLVSGRPANAVLVTSGSDVRFRRILLKTLQSLRRMGIILFAPGDDAESRTGTADVWGACALALQGPHLRFLPDGHYSYDFDPERRRRVSDLVTARVLEANDVDLVLALGNEAAFDTARRIHDIPVLALASSNPVESSLVLSAEDSGQQNFHCVVEKDYYRRQVRFFHSIVRFGNLGLIADASRPAEAGVREIEKAAVNLGSGIETALWDSAGLSEAESFAQLLAALERLLKSGCDAVMLPRFQCGSDDFRRLTDLLRRYRVPSFSLDGTEAVERGTLMSCGDSDLDALGRFEAAVIARVLEGTPPREIPQVFLPAGGLAVNLKSAAEIGWTPSFAVLTTVEKAFSTQSPRIETGRLGLPPK